MMSDVGTTTRTEGSVEGMSRKEPSTRKDSISFRGGGGGGGRGASDQKQASEVYSVHAET